MPADATANRARRRCTAGWAPRVRRRASTRPGLPLGHRRQVDRVHAAAVQQGHGAVGEGRGLRVVGGQDDRDAVRAGRRGERAQDVGAVGAVQGGRGFVREQDGGGRGEGPGDRDALPLGLLQFVRASARLVADVEAFQPLQGGRLGALAAGAAEHQGQGGVLPGVQLGYEHGCRVDPAEAVAAQALTGHRAHGVDRRAVEPDLAALGRHQAGQAAQQGRLAAAPGAADGEDLALADPERDAGERGRAVTVLEVQGACPEHVVVRRGHHPRTPRFRSVFAVPHPPCGGTKTGPIGHSAR